MDRGPDFSEAEQSRAVEVEVEAIARVSLSLSLKPSDCHESLSNAANGNG
jgi:hypothetical protein